MSTTTIRLDDELKVRVAAAAERAGKTAHAFMLEAISETVAQAEFESEFQRIGEQRWSQLLSTGKTIAWEDAKPYLAARARGQTPPVPRARKARR